MNKIYKVIWSKVRNCYVAVSEIAKRNGKNSGVVGGAVVGGASVNCGASENYGAKANRRRGLRMTAVTLGVAALVGGVGFGTPAAWADSSDNNLSITTDVTESVYGGKSSSDSSGIIGGYSSVPTNKADRNTVTVGAVKAQSVFGGYSEKDVAFGNNVLIKGSTISAGDVYGGLAMKYPSFNTVTITGGTVGGSVYGGSLIGGEDAENVISNNVEISEGTIGSDGTKVVVGGDSSEGKGEASGNKVTVSGGTVNASVYGGYSSSGRASGNTVTISKTDTTVPNINGMVYGGYSQSGTAGGEVTDTDPYKNGNKVSISGGTVNYWVFGGCSDSGAARYNTIEISGGTITNMVYGGRGATDTTGNKVTITGGTISSSQIYGGFTDLEVGITSVAAKGNAVTIEGGDFTNTAIYGGSTDGHNASGNAVTISTINNGALGAVYGGYVDNNSGTAGDSAAGNVVTINGGKVELVYGGLTKIGTAGGEGTTDDPYENGNKVTITGGEVGTVFGGSSNNGTAINNQVSISGGTVNSMVYGGEASTDTTGNKVTIEDGEVGTVYGGFSGEGTAINNQVSISGSTVKVNNRIYGGYSQSGVAGGEGTTEDPYKNGNKVNISGGTVTSWVYGGFSSSGAARYNTIEISDGTIGTSGNNICGGRGATDATGNKVTITGGTIKSEVYGGYSFNGTAINNQVTITGGKVKTVYGGGSDNNCTTSNNQVTISGGEVIDVFGGFTLSGAATGNTVTIEGGEVKTVYGGSSGTGTASNNRVTISGGTVNGEVYGGKGVEANNNTVEISVANFKAASICVGDGATSTGNTLVLGAKGVEVTGTQGVGGVQIIALTDKVQFENNTTVLKADKFSKDSKTAANAANFDGTLDISAATGLQGATAPGVMTLLQSDTENNFTTLDLKYKDATGSEQTANLSGKTTSQIVWEGAAQEDEKNGVKLVYSNTHTVSVAAGGKTITYNIANPVGDVTLGSIDWVKGGTARTLTAAEKALLTVNGKTAVNTADLTFTGTIHENPLNQSMTLLAGATGITGDHITQAGEGKGEIAVAYTDAKGIALNARAKGEVSVASGSVKYTINRVALDKATLGSLAWGDTDSLPESWQASGTTQIDDTNFAYTGTASTALKAGNTATILTAPGLLATSPVTVGTVEGKTVDVNYTDDAGVSYTATASGHVAAAKGAVNYVVDSVAATGVNLQSWNGKDASTAITTNGWTGTGVAVATGSFAAPTDLNLGETRTITAAPTGFFGTVTGSNAYPSNGGTLSEDTGGVKLAGSMIGGVKAEDDGTTATLTYYAMKKTADTMTLGTFAFADGDANARTYGKEYDLTNAEITTDGLAFTEDSKTTMETGNKMTLVDASGAYKNGGAALKALSSGAKTSFAVAFTDTIESKGITFAGTHTDTLTQDTTKTKLTYTVGDKNVSTATLSGDIAWSDGGVHYTNGNDANQNGTKASYKFDGNTAVNISGVSFSATADPLNQSMTLLKGVDGVAADKVSGTPAFTVTLDQTNTKLDAKATGAAAVSGNDVTYTVSGVTIDKVNVKSVGSIADTVPENWTLATGATIETNGMSTPTLDPGKHIDILQSNTDNFFANAKINGDNAYKPYNFTEKENSITFAGSQSRGVTLNSEQNHLIYAAGTKDVQTATLSGDITWSDGGVHYTNKQYTFSDASQIVFDKDAAFTATADPLNTSMTLIGSDSAEHAVKGTVSGTPGFTVKMNNTSLDATVTGAATVESGNLKYSVTAVTLNKVTVDGVGSDAVPEGWSTAADVQVDTESMNVPTDAAYGQPQNIMTSDKPVFDDSNITGSNKYGETPAAFTDTDSKETPAVKIEGTQDAGVKASADKKSLVYEVGKKEATSVKLGTVTWAAGSQLMDGSNGEYDYSSVKSVDTGSFAVNYASPQTIDVSKNESMTLLQANDTLKAIVNEEKKQAYSYTPVTGVTMDANIIGRLTNNSGAVTYAPTANKAVSLIFGDVDWLDSGALIDHKTTLTNVSFDGAAVDTTKINFTNKEFMEADKQMTLVSDFGGKPGSITGSKYMVGTGFEGEGSASMEDGNLIFKTRTGAGVSEQTHKTVMAMEADVALLNAGSEHIDNVMTGLGNPANMGEDGTSTSASIGGGGSRYETGSHVSSHTWNAAVGIGRRRELDKGTLEYGIFGEYGKSSYTLHSDAGKGDGDSHHAGGGLLAKWTNKHDVYTEASFRLGRMSNSASNVLRDAAGNGFGYDVHATYYGAHVGVGKIFRYNGGRSLDVYGKFFYTKRNGVNFTAAAQQYDLDSVASSILRIGARYGTTDKKWNWYGGLAYEYEFDGEASGTVNGAAVRAASIKGGSGRAEIGMRMNATKTNPWQADISLYGYAGKHRGFGGNISVAYMF